MRAAWRPSAAVGQRIEEFRGDAGDRAAVTPPAGEPRAFPGAAAGPGIGTFAPIAGHPFGHRLGFMSTDDRVAKLEEQITSLHDQQADLRKQ